MSHVVSLSQEILRGLILSFQLLFHTGKLLVRDIVCRLFPFALSEPARLERLGIDLLLSVLPALR